MSFGACTHIAAGTVVRDLHQRHVDAIIYSLQETRTPGPASLS